MDPQSGEQDLDSWDMNFCGGWCFYFGRTSTWLSTCCWVLLETACRTFFETVFQINRQHGWKCSWSFSSVSENLGTGCRNMGQITQSFSKKLSSPIAFILTCIMSDINLTSHTKFLSLIALSPRLCLKCENCTCRMRTLKLLVSWDWGCVPQLHLSSCLCSVFLVFLPFGK